LPVALAVACAVATVDAKQRTAVPVLQRFLARADGPPVEYRALRHLEARNDHFGASGWIDAWTEFDRAHGFTFEVVGEGGSAYIRKRVLLAALEGEQRLWASSEPQRASLTPDNYSFHDGGSTPDGLEWLGVKPKRKDVLLVEGSIFIQPDDGELARIEGRLSKAPSFWTRRVEIVRQYQRIGGVRVPVAIESVAHVLIAGRSTFRMTYEYETINGQRVGNPQPHQPPQSETTAAGAGAVN
jgi:hypothetical protein